MISPRRHSRINSLYLEIVAKSFEKIEELKNYFITVTAVETTKDLKTLKIFYSHMHPDEADQIQKILEKKSNLIRSQFLKNRAVKNIPKINIIYDETPARAERIFRILKEIEKEKH
ncbi:MAG: ribosome-binding factor A [bacterium]|nr:ribosome-binding factor A [bacterium]